MFGYVSNYGTKTLSKFERAENILCKETQALIKKISK